MVQCDAMRCDPGQEKLDSLAGSCKVVVVVLVLVLVLVALARKGESGRHGSREGLLR